MQLNSFCRQCRMAVGAILTLGLLTACSSPQAPQTVATPSGPVIKATNYSEAPGQVPARFEEVTGTCLASPELEAQLATLNEKPGSEAGTFFILLNPQNPSQGILAKTGTDLSSQQLQSASSGKLTVTGNVKTLNMPTLPEFCQKTYGVKLALAADKPLYVECENDLGQSTGSQPATTPAPAAATPQAQTAQ